MAVTAKGSILVRLSSSDSNQSGAEDAVCLCRVAGDDNDYGLGMFDFIPAGVFVDTETDGA